MINYKDINIQPINMMGMQLDEVTYKGCKASFGTEPGWATIYSIESSEQGKGHAQHLLLQAKEYYEQQNKVVGSSVTLNPVIKHIIDKLGIPEYSDY